MSLERICGRIADITTYVFAAILLALAITTMSSIDVVQEFSFSLALAGAVSWIDVACVALFCVYLIIMSLSEKKTGVRRTKTTAGIMLAVIGAVLIVSFVAFIAAVLASAFSSINPDRPPYDFMDKMGLPLLHLPCVIILVLNIIACWANFRSSVNVKPISPSLDDPNRSRKNVFSGVTIGIYTAIAALMLLYYLFLLVVFLSL